MIENIFVFCATKEDQQRWIKLLTQEQTANSSLIKSSMTSRVSYNLPPYVRLSRYFAKLVKKKIIRLEILKKLLYLQYILKPDMSNVKMRKTNITTYILHPMQTNSQDCYSQNSENMVLNNIKTKHSPVETTQTMLRKSTLILEVKYALEDIDLSTIGLAHDSCLTEFASAQNGTCEISKSLPFIGIESSINNFMNNNNVNNNLVDGQSPYRSRFTNLIHSYPIGSNFHKDIFNEMEKRIDSIKCWKGKGFIDEQISKNSNINKHCCQFQTYIPKKIYQASDFQANVISVGSLDSGMVESYCLNSSEINSSCKLCTYIDNKYNVEHPVRIYSSESENDESKFEYQCICTSPFGSTPRNSIHLCNLSKHNENAQDLSMCKTNMKDHNSKHILATNEIQTQINTIYVPLNKYEHKVQKRFTQPIPYIHQTIVRKVGRRVIQPSHPIVKNNYNGTNQIYKSGLYAHWWLKKFIPLSGCSDQGKLPWHGCFIFFSHLINVFACFNTNYVLLSARMTHTHIDRKKQRERERERETYACLVHTSICFFFYSHVV